MPHALAERPPSSPQRLAPMPDLHPLSTTPHLDVAELRRLAVAAAEAGGRTLLACADRFSTREKAPADLVTDADIASQQAVRDMLLGVRPDDAFVGEESPPGNPAGRRGRVCWVVDPLDGTTNYVHGFPMYATSVAATLDGALLAGAVFDPVRGEMFSAARGAGAWLGEKPLRATQAERLSDALVAVSLPPRVDRESADLAGFIAVVGRSRAVRRTGAAALNLAYVAAGRLDAHWAFSIHPWDAAAGVLLCAEAGASVSDARGAPFDLWRADYLVAATPALHAELRAVLGASAG